MELKRLRKGLEVQLIRLGLVVVPRLPRRCVVWLAAGLGRAGYLLARGSRRIGRANLELALGDELDSRAKRRILRESFQTFALVLLDILWFTRHPRERLRRFIRFDESTLARLEQTPLICVTGHLGNWESLGQAVANAGFPLHSVAAPLSNPGVDRLFIPSRQLTGQVILSSEGALRPLLRVLKEGGRFAILLDQNTKPDEGGIFVPFFGVPVPMSAGAAMLALRTRCNLIFGFCIPQPDGTYRVDVPAWIPAGDLPPAGGEAVTTLTRRIASELEKAVRTYPGQWLWMYKRWKYVPPGADACAFPSYARPLHRTAPDRARAATPTDASQPE
jgi:Kdo2-lipid IVA lauroyltransferase/acyltransferase